MTRPTRTIPRILDVFPSLLLIASLAAGSISTASAQGTREDYERSSSYRSRTRNLVFRDSVEPHWFGAQQNRFWYRLQTSADSHQFILVDAIAGERREAFDHQQLADQLTETTSKTANPKRLQLESLSFDDDAGSCQFRFAGKAWSYRLPNGPLTTADNKQAASGREGLPAESRIRRSRHGGDRTPIRFANRTDQSLRYFWVMPEGGLRLYGTVAAGESQQLSTYAGHAWVLKNDQGKSVAAFVASSSTELAVIDENTVEPQPYRGRRRGRDRANRATSPDGRWRVELDDHNVSVVDTQSNETAALTSDGSPDDRYGGRVWWSSDSEHFVVMKTIPGMGRTIDLIEAAPDDSIHAELQTIPYAKPGDAVDQARPVLFSRADDFRPRLINSESFDNPFALRDLAWHDSSGSFSFLYNQRGHQVLRLIQVDTESATAKTIIDETSDTFVCYSSKTYLHRIDSTDELIWMSERNGWNHLYLIDALTGNVKNAITSGQWVVRGVERVDDVQRRLHLRVSGIDKEQDPYHVHLIRIDYDGENLVRLTEGDGNHRWRFSPDGRFLIDTYSRVDLPPVSELRDAETGELICELERADAEALLATSWQPPERFVAKGRDGETDIHGIIVRPTNFDPDKRYPVLEHIYAGPHSSFVPKSFGLHNELYSMAELGFIVVKMDGMGTSNRSKAFHDVCWQNLGDSGFPDRVAWIKAAAETRPEMDLSRVGIWGGSAGGQSAMRALITHGDFYHAAVADCGCHDNRVDKIWWNEQWMGWPIGPHYAEQSNVTQAHRVEGDLMLIWGELDRNVDPASTMQVVNALVKADKDFEQLIMPGTGHGAAGHPYAKRRQADFFVRKLWGKEPRREE